MRKRHFKFQMNFPLSSRAVYLLLLLFLTLNALLFTLPVYAQSSTPPPNQVNYRSEASVDIAVGNPPVAQAQCGGANIQNIAPNHNNCNGYYSLHNPVGNFGDPNCEFANNPAKAKSNLFDLLKQLDPGYEHLWYQLIQYESSYNPNAYLGSSTSGAGAYGLVQMNPAGHSQYDRGDVYWQLQISDGINYNNKVLNPNSTNGGGCGGLGASYCWGAKPNSTYCPSGSTWTTAWCYWPYCETGGVPGVGLICKKKTSC